MPSVPTSTRKEAMRSLVSGMRDSEKKHDFFLISISWISGRPLIMRESALSMQNNNTTAAASHRRVVALWFGSRVCVGAGVGTAGRLVAGHAGLVAGRGIARLMRDANERERAEHAK